MELLPDTPAEVFKLRELEDRMGQVVDWVYEENSKASHRRSHEFNLAMSIQDFFSRQFNFLKIDKRYFSRLKEIEETEEAFKLAYREAKAMLDHDVILSHAMIMAPIVTLRENETIKIRAQYKMDMINERIMNDKKKERKTRESKRGKIDRGDRAIPETDREEEITDEGTGS